jgi:hypothetical protein
MRLHSGLAAFILLASARPGFAQDACHYEPGTWNVPNGAIVLSRAYHGTVRAAMDALGENWTHSMISHGNGWVTHATMKSPDKGGCNTPLDAGSLQHGFPGAEQITVAGAQTNLYDTDDSPVDIAYYNSNDTGILSACICLSSPCTCPPPPPPKGVQMANWVWGNVPYQWTVSQGSSSNGFYLLDLDDVGAGYRTNTFYSVYQLKNTDLRSLGSTPQAGGTVCSTTIAWAQSNAGFGWLYPYTYNRQQVSNALYSMWNGTDWECNNGGGWFVHNWIFGLLCLDFNGLCDEADDQVNDCTAANQCNTSDQDLWHGIAANPTTTAWSVSPTLLVGETPFGGYSSNSIYRNSPRNQPTWSGSVYGCWY